MSKTDCDKNCRDIISLKNLTKSYRIFNFGFPFFKHFNALKEINLEIKKGEVVGVIGHNGAGKSTLLRLLAGTSSPSRGEVKTLGRVLAILNISTGLEDELTGSDNIPHIAKLYGLELSDEDQHEIKEFSGLNESINHKVRTYSTGMKMRLAFSILTSLPFDILLIDEALSVGDSGFALKCRERIRKLCNSGKTVVVVSHSMLAIRELCDRVIWLDNGRIKQDGDPLLVTELYRAGLIENEKKEREIRLKHREKIKNSSLVTIQKCNLLNCDEEEAVIIKVGESLKVILELETKDFLNGLFLEIDLFRSDGVLISNTKEQINLRQGKNILSLLLGEIRLGRFVYEIQIRLITQEEIIAEASKIFSVFNDTFTYNSSYYPKISWGVQSV